MSVRAAVVVVLLVLSGVGAAVSGREMFFNLAYLWAGLLLLSWVWSRLTLAGLSLVREPGANRAQVGRLFEERFALRNASRWPKLWLEIQDTSDLPLHRASSVALSVGARSERTWLVRTPCIRRGRFRLGPATFYGGDPFGLFPVRRAIPETHHLVVIPMAVSLRAFDLPSGYRPGGEALRHRTHQVTPSATSVRDYAPGDGFNRIHWPSSARKDRLIVKEFELDPKADIWIFLDASSRAQAGSSEFHEAEAPSWTAPWKVRLPPSTEEYAVAAAASIARWLVQHDRAVGLAVYGKARQVIQPDRGERQLHRLLESLAVVEAQGWLALEDLVKIESAQIPRGSSVVMVTPSVSPGLLVTARLLNRRGLVPALIFDAASFGGPEGSRALASAAQRNGFVVRVVALGDDLGGALSDVRLETRPIPTAA
jgi:uncharacterized protein (DUF58 family)